MKDWRWLLLVLALVVGLLQHRLWYGPGNTGQVQALQAQVDAQKRDNQGLQQRNDALAAEVMDLKDGESAIEERARSELGIAREQVLAMGDSGNDCAMLRYAGVGAAMGNAGEQAKKAADVIAPSNREDGVAWMLRRAARGEV